MFNFIKFGSTNYKAVEFTQSVGYIKTGLLPSLNGIEVTNDLFGDEGDRFRTAHQKINFGGLSVGNIIFTGDPSVYNNALIPGGERNTYLNDPYGANKYGNGIFYFGSGIFRAGWDSEEIRNTFQNIIGQDIIYSAHRLQNGTINVGRITSLTK